MENNMCSSSCKCSSKAWLFYSLAMAVLYFGLDSFFHGYLLKSVYADSAALFRPMDQMMAMMKVSYLGYILFGMLFTFLYSKGYESGKSAVAQGFRFGAFLGFFYWGVNLLTCYPYLNFPNQIYWAWAGVGIFEFVLLGMILGMMYKPYK